MFAKFTTSATSESAIEVGSSQIGTIVSGEYIEDQIYLTIAFPISGLYTVPDYEVVQFDKVKFNSSATSNIALAVGTEEVGDLMNIGA